MPDRLPLKHLPSKRLGGSCRDVPRCARAVFMFSLLYVHPSDEESNHDRRTRWQESPIHEADHWPPTVHIAVGKDRHSRRQHRCGKNHAGLPTGTPARLSTIPGAGQQKPVPGEVLPRPQQVRAEAAAVDLQTALSHVRRSSQAFTGDGAGRHSGPVPVQRCCVCRCELSARKYLP